MTGNLLQLHRRLQSAQPQLPRKVVTGAILLGALLLSVVVGMKPSILLLVPVVAIAAFIILTKRPEIGLVAIIVVSMVISFTVGTGTGTAIPANMLVVAGVTGVWVLNIVTGNWEGELRWSKSFLPLFLFVGVAVIAFFSGLLPWFDFASGASVTAQLGGLALFIFSGLTFFWISQRIEDLRWLELSTWVFIGLGGMLLVGNLVPQLSTLRQLFARGVENGSLFWIWLAALAFAQVLFNRRLHLVWRLGLVALLVAQGLFTYHYNGGWKSGWVPPVVAVLAVVAIRWPRMVLLFGLVAIIPGLDVVSGLIESDQYSYSTRLEAWELIAEIVKMNPVLGLGPANYYYYTPLFPIRGYSVEFNSHNQYVDLIAQVGLLGLFFFSWFFAEVGKLGWRLRTRVREGFSEAYVYGALGGLVGTAVAGMLGDWIIPFVYNVGFSGFRASVLGWIFLGGLVALAHGTTKESGLE